MVLSIIKFLIWFLIIPEFIGLGILSFKKENNKNMILALIIGFIASFAVFEILAIPMIFKHATFMTLVITWTIIMCVLAVASLIKVAKNLKDIIAENVKCFKKLPKFLTIVAVILVVIQAFVSFQYMHIDEDDANFVAKATTAYDTNTLYEYSDTGVETSDIPSRNGLSPYPIYTATMAKLVGTHPAIMAHTIFASFFVCFAYLLYYLIGKALFKGDKIKTMTFVIVLAILFIFGNYSRYSVFVRLLTRLWQGKSMLCVVIIPFIWYIFIEYIGEEKDGFYWFILLLTLWGADLLSTMALFLPSMVFVLLSVFYAIKCKKPKYILYMILCLIPTLGYGLTYLTLI